MPRNFNRVICVGILLLTVVAALLNPAAFAQQVPSPQASTAATNLTAEPLQRLIQGREEHLYEISVKSGEYDEVVVRQLGIDVVVELCDQTGKLIARYDAENRIPSQESLGVTTESDATFQLKIKPKYPRARAGEYEIRIAQVRPSAEQDRRNLEAHRLGTMAENLGASGKYDDALKTAREALANAELSNGSDPSYLAKICSMIAANSRIKGDKKTAEQFFKRALELDEKTLGHEHPKTAWDMQVLGNLYRTLDDYGRSESLLREAVAITEKTLGPDHPRVAECLRDISYLHEERGELDLALAELKRGVAITQKSLDPDDFTSMTLTSNLGDCYYLRHEYDLAEPLLQRAVEIVEKKFGPDYPNVTIPLLPLAVIAREKKQYQRSLDLLLHAEAIREKAFGKQSTQTAELLISIGNVYHAQGNYAKALELFQQSRVVLEVTAGPYNEDTLLTLLNSARDYAASGNLDKALEYQARAEQVYEKAIEMNVSIGSEREKLAYLENLSRRTDRTISLNLQQMPRSEDAAKLAALVVLQRKGRVLDAMASSLNTVRSHLNAGDQSLLDELNSTNSQLAQAALRGPGKTPAADFQKNVSSLEEKRDSLESAISARSSEFVALTRPVTLVAVEQAIPADAALIEFVLYRPFDPRAATMDEEYGEERYVAYVLRKNGEVHWRDLGLAAPIDAAVDRFRTSLRNPDRKDAAQIGRLLDRKLMQPLVSAIGDARHLLISPDADLNLFPFEALVDGQGRFRLQDQAITYVTSGRDLLRMQSPRPHPGDPVVVAAPQFGNPGSLEMAKFSGQPSLTGTNARRSITSSDNLSKVFFAPLPGTAEEARRIKALFPATKVLTDTAASKSAIMAVNAPQILHIATHGFFLGELNSSGKPHDKDPVKRSKDVADNPLLRSGLALSGANVLESDGKRDGILTALEAANIDLWGTKLVTLSACDTGIGAVKNREGVYGLRRSFFLAGTETLVMSLWPVSDYVTREMMTSYYTGLKKGLGRGEALRQAQLSMMKRKGRSHPFYWASFITSGEWANLDGKR